MSETVRLGMTGDVMLGRKVDEYQQRRHPEAVWGNLRERLAGLDGLLINLECCLSTRGERWTRTHRPFHFRADPEWAVPALERADVDCCSLANNHLLDFGETALRDTLSHLDDADIAHAGAGENLDKALEPATFTAGDAHVAVVSFTDNTPEFAASETSPGVARVAFDVEDDRARELVTDALSRAKRHDPDLLVASLHWGPNMVEKPPRAFEKFGRWLANQDVDIVHGHSAHVLQGIEVYDGALICYDMGDFVDDYAVDRELRNDRSFLFEIRLGERENPQELRLFPVEIYDMAVHEASRETAAWARDRIQMLSEPYGTTFERDGDELVLSLRE